MPVPDVGYFRVQPIHPPETIARAASLAARTLTTLAGGALIAWSITADARWAERHVLGAYCATSRGEWVVARAAPWIAAALGVVVIWKLAPALASRMARISARVSPGAVAGIVLAVAAALGVGELVARSMHDRLLGAGPLSGNLREAPMTRPDPRLGWSYHPGRTTWTRVAGRVVSYAIDPEGDRADSTDRRADPTRPTILFAGESIAFGYGLTYEETLPYLVGRDLGVQAVNLAVVGYGNDQAYLRVLDALPRFARTSAVVTVFVPDQIGRNVDSWRPRLGVAPDGTLVPLPPSSGPRILRLLQQLPFRGEEPLRVTAAILRATADAARARGAFPLFVVTNYGPSCLHEQGEEPWIVDELFVRQGLPFVRVDLDRDDLLGGAFERHPAARGALKIANAVERALSGRVGPDAVETSTPSRGCDGR
jgi:hypothetical protein